MKVLALFGFVWCLGAVVMNLLTLNLTYAGVWAAIAIPWAMAYFRRPRAGRRG